MDAENNILNTNKNGKGNELFPVFFRMDKLKVLVVGGGLVGTEKIGAILKNSPAATIHVVAPEISKEIVDWSVQYSGLTLNYKEYNQTDLIDMDLVVAATCIRPLNAQVQLDAKNGGVLINVADTPELCDFYLGSIVQKGDLKIAISTNGQSPTFAKRMRELLEEALPDSIDDILQQLNDIRNKLKGDFEYKVKKMDEITKAMKEEQK
ncbi:bifunctional precorrin-2 dehydrogenase/sirohydrochlorin ferrochelatase [uncultured Cytophaga sp.]|uniref:precorrin-2 dehydrogenase/sirohydrochlorin ferrochelatase family protein n=1 Tax=uncultured Cytophaga sp. TaxID=160238 RepID=UPI0026186490|nr:bifunctional precorrin-2 dehydrogenase/sirohydrochlorin ferrochelatase [uncultured Cytophaga sp.]